MTKDEAERVKRVIEVLACGAGYSMSGISIEAHVCELEDLLGEFMWINGPVFVKEENDDKE